MVIIIIKIITRLTIMELFPHISMVTMTTFAGTSLIIKKTNWVEQARKINKYINK